MCFQQTESLIAGKKIQIVTSYCVDPKQIKQNLGTEDIPTCGCW